MFLAVLVLHRFFNVHVIFVVCDLVLSSVTHCSPPIAGDARPKHGGVRS